MGINLGGLLAPLVSGSVGEMFNFRYGFLTAGVAMLFGLLQFKTSGHHLGDAGLAPKNLSAADRARGWRWVTLGVGVLIAAVAAGGVGLYTVSAHAVADTFRHLMYAIAVLYFGYILMFGGLDGAEKRRVGVMIVLFVCSALFWAGFEQAGTTFNLFARDLTDRSFLGSYFSSGEHPATWYQSFNSVCIIALSPFFAWLWLSLGRRNLDPSAPVKFGMGLVMLGAGFAVLLFAANLILSTGGKVGPQWLLLTYLLHTTGELCLSPVGLSNFTKLAPTRFVSQLMGMWFLATAIGNLAAGQIGGHIGSDVNTMPTEFLHMTLYGVGCGVLLLLFGPLLRRWMGGIH
jgi:POT family proton-dependent oligopeptide transporter